MATQNLLAETAVYEAAERVADRVPSTLALGGFEIELHLPGTPRRRSRSLVATRIGGTWRRGRRTGPVSIDVLAVGSWGSLVTVVLEAVPRGWSDEVAWQIARLLQARAEAEPDPPPVPTGSSRGTSPSQALGLTPG